MNLNIYDIYINKFIEVNITEKDYLKLTSEEELWQDFVTGYQKVVQESGFKLNTKFVHNKVIYVIILLRGYHNIDKLLC